MTEKDYILVSNYNHLKRAFDDISCIICGNGEEITQAERSDLLVKINDFKGKISGKINIKGD